MIKKKKERGITLSDFKLFLQGHSNHNMVLAKKKKKKKDMQINGTEQRSQK